MAYPSPNQLRLNYSNVKDPEISSEDYQKWGADVHIVDDVNYVGVQRTAFYSLLVDTKNEHGKESWDFILLAEWSDNRLWYTDPSIMGPLPIHHELLRGKSVIDIAEISPTHWNLIQAYNPNQVGHGPYPVFVTWQRLASSSTDEADFVKWLNEEHLPSIARITGFKRARHCKADPRAPWVTEETAAKHLVTYEFEDLAGFQSAEFRKCLETYLAKKLEGEAKTSELHAYRLVNTFGKW